MNLNKFDLQVVLRVILIVATCFLLSWSLQQHFMLFTTMGIAILLVVETLLLIYYLKSIQKDVQRFIDAIRNQDTGLTFKKREKKTHLKNIYQGFNEILKNFSLVRKEKQQEHHFFQTTIEHITIGLIAYRENGEIQWQNKAFKEMMAFNNLHNINNLNYLRADLGGNLLNLKHGEEKLEKIPINNEIKNISIKVSEIKQGEHNIKIASFQDISRDIDKNEIEAWQKIIKVLRHEIMNSISPIRIMSGNLINLLNENKDKIPPVIFKKLDKGLEVTYKRSKGLTKFVESYSKISKIPQPFFSKVKVSELLYDTKVMTSKLDKETANITIKVEPSDLQLFCDENLIQQLLLNLITNSLESSKNKSKLTIELSAYNDDRNTIINVSDNGQGIPGEQLEKIFIPFYSTKENGSGIGLSLARQIMMLHNGSIKASSSQGKGAQFVLKF